MESCLVLCYILNQLSIRKKTFKYLEKLKYCQCSAVTIDQWILVQSDFKSVCGLVFNSDLKFFSSPISILVSWVTSLLCQTCFFSATLQLVTFHLFVSADSFATCEMFSLRLLFVYFQAYKAKNKTKHHNKKMIEKKLKFDFSLYRILFFPQSTSLHNLSFLKLRFFLFFLSLFVLDVVPFLP